MRCGQSPWRRSPMEDDQLLLASLPVPEVPSPSPFLLPSPSPLIPPPRSGKHSSQALCLAACNSNSNRNRPHCSSSCSRLDCCHQFRFLFLHGSPFFHLSARQQDVWMCLSHRCIHGASADRSSCIYFFFLIISYSITDAYMEHV